MAKEALRLRLRGCWVSKCLPFWAICLLYHSVWQCGWESQACRRGCAWRRALARFPLAGPSCLPLYPREPCLFICYYIGIGRSKAGGPSATTTLAPFLFLFFSLSAVHFFSLSFSVLLPTSLPMLASSSTCYTSLSLPLFVSETLYSFSLLCPPASLHVCPLQLRLYRWADDRVWYLLADGDWGVLATVVVSYPRGASVGLHWWGFPSFNEDYHVCVCMSVMIILLIISHF